jgi:hypothetical protein
VTTSKGLAGAFDQRASQLNQSVGLWMLGLLAALAIGATIGGNRIESLTLAASMKDPLWGVIFMQVMLSVLSIGAPIWFAWLATKQIGQRFRLSEDYAFKASIAKAYEGYRREAARIDPKFEASLFASALTRLDEAPLRLVEVGSHGSPMHELFSSRPFQNALKTIPDFKETVVAAVRRAGGKSAELSDLASSKAAEPPAPA